jgi:hypothetical protein
MNGAILPEIRKGILSPKDTHGNRQLSEMTISRLNLIYAKDYSTSRDINIIRMGYRELGR